jgi:osmoprotectant transport system substrate-binding protein
MRNIVRIGAATLVAFAMGTSLASAQVVVSSKIDTEGGLLGNIISQVLQANGVPVTERIQLGATSVMREAITAGQIDIYPEYTGNAAFFFNKADDPLWNDAAKAYAEAAKLDYDANKIVWLAPAPANNTWAVALRKDVADANAIATFSDFGKYVAGGGEVKLAASAEFVSSPAALPKFQEVYGFTLKPEQLVTLSGGDTAATIAAAAQQTDGVNAAMVYGTDGGIAPSGLTVLTDDKGVQPVYEPSPIVREAVLAQYPQIKDLLAPVFAKLDLTTLQELNGRIQVGGESAQAVAVDWLKTNGFLK